MKRSLSMILLLVFAISLISPVFQNAYAATSADYSISENGVAFICAREGFSPTCYVDASQSSIGYGTKCTGSSQQPHAAGAHSITRDAALAEMKSQIESRYSPNVRRQTNGLTMTQSQFDALVSLCYNTGGGTSIISNAPLVKYLKGILTEAQARAEYSSYYIKSGGVVLQGLINRRNAEADLFFSEPLSDTPGKPAFHNMQSKYPQNTEVIFAWDATENTTHYNFYLYKETNSGEWYVYEQSFFVQSGFSRFLKEGSYRAMLQAYNSEVWNADHTDWLYTQSDFVYFDVWGEHTCDMNGPYRYVWNAHPHYKCYECSVCGEVHENQEEPTLLNGCEICLENHEHDREKYLWVWAAHPHYKCYRCSFCGQEWADYSQPTVSDSCLECHRPSKPYFVNMKEEYSTGESLVFAWTASDNTTHYNLWIYREDATGNWNVVKRMPEVDSGLLIEELPIGSYSAILQAYNREYWEADHSDWLCRYSDYIYFSIACDHSYVSMITNPTCLEQGFTTHTCINCGDSYKDTYVGATGHAWDDGIEVLKASCTEVGERVFSCGSCGELRSEEVAPWGHSYTAIATTPTCTEKGYTTYTCSLCGDSYIADEVTALGHRYEASVTAPTCAKAGFTTYTCTVCGDSYISDNVPATGHNYSNGSCTNCGAEDPDWLPNNPFVDVKESDYFYTPVLWAVQRGITTGTSATTFSPNDPCTRGQIVTFLWRACGSPEPSSTKNPFADVKPGDYYYKAVLWAVEQGITTGLSATKFGPNEACTRGQVATFLWRSQGKPAPTSSNNPFKDVRSSDYYYEAVLWAVENNVTQGTGAGRFSPNDSCTRGQIVTFLYRALAN